jgi:hypothetical protein
MWLPKSEAKFNIGQKRITPKNLSRFVDNTNNLYQTSGIYLAESPITSNVWGNRLLEVWIDEDLIKEGYVEHFEGAGKDWWLVKLSDLIEDKKLDTPKKLKEINIQFKNFEGMALSRSMMLEAIKEMKKEGKPKKVALFKLALSERKYKWNKNSRGQPVCAEYSKDMRIIAVVDKKNCDKDELDQNLPELPKSVPYSGFPMDFEDLSNRTLFYKVGHAVAKVKEFFKLTFGIQKKCDEQSLFLYE